MPVITTREADTVVRIKDGETVVIAGLIQERKFKDRTGIKGLSSVPLLGPLFRMDTEEMRNTELGSISDSADNSREVRDNR